jgi:hypothetical protein
MGKKTGRKAWTKRKEFRKVRTCPSCGRVLTKRGPLCGYCKRSIKTKRTHCIDCGEALPKHNIYRGDLRCKACSLLKRNEDMRVLCEQSLQLYESGFTEEEICILVNRSWMRVRAYIRTKYPMFKKTNQNSVSHKEAIEMVRNLIKGGMTEEQIQSAYPQTKIKKALIAINMEKHYGRAQEDSSPSKRVRLKK